MSPRPSVELERRDEVLRATCGQIAQVGFRRIRVADIAARAGLSTGIIHYYFETKEDLLDAAFRYAVAQSRKRSEAALSGLDDPWERLTVLLDAHLPGANSEGEWVIWLHLWAEASVREEFKPLNDASYQEWVELVESVVVDGQRRGVFRPIDCRDFVLRLLTMMDGLVIQHEMGAMGIDETRIHDLLVGFARDQLLNES